MIVKWVQPADKEAGPTGAGPGDEQSRRAGPLGRHRPPDFGQELAEGVHCGQQVPCGHGEELMT